MCTKSPLRCLERITVRFFSLFFEKVNQQDGHEGREQKRLKLGKSFQKLLQQHEGKIRKAGLSASERRGCHGGTGASIAGGGEGCCF